MESWEKNFWMVWVAELLSICGFMFVLPFLPYYIQKLGITELRQVALWAGIVGTVPLLASAFATPFWGSLADRFGRKMMLVRAMFAGCVIVALMGFVGNVGQLLALRTAQGIFTGTITAAFALVASICPKERAGYAQGLMQTSVLLGSSLGPWVGGFAADACGYRNAFLISGGLLAAAGIMTAFGVREEFTPHQPTGREPGMHRLVLERRFLSLFVVLFVVQMAATIATPVFPLFVQQLAPGGSGLASTAGSIFGISGIAAMLAAVTIGKASDAVGSLRVLMICTLAAGILSIAAAFSRSSWHLLFFQVGFGFFSGGLVPILYAVLHGRVSAHEIGRVFGIAGGISAFAGGLGPLVGGAVASAVTVPFAFVVRGVLLMLVSVPFFVVLRRRRRAGVT